MAYTAPTLRTTGELITASIWNTDLVNNIIYLYGRAMMLFSGIPYTFVGSADQGNVGTGYVSGATYASLVPWTSILYVADCSVFSGVTMALEAMLKAESGATATLALFNLTDAPDVALTNSPITSTDATGARVRTSSAITLPTSGAKAFGVKLHSGHATLQAWAWGIRFFPVD